MSDTKKDSKFTKDEIEQLNKIQQTYSQTQNSLGQLSIAKLRLEKQLKDYDMVENELKEAFFNNQIIEQEFINKITDKYGEITLDPETGKFTTN